MAPFERIELDSDAWRAGEGFAVVGDKAASNSASLEDHGAQPIKALTSRGAPCSADLVRVRRKMGRKAFGASRDRGVTAKLGRDRLSA
jgi:hypothetical protein